MASEAPPFWWENPGWRARGLMPLSWIYGAISARFMTKARRERIDVPVLCVGNFTVGGSGKTPVAMALARHAREKGLKPGFLSRGHGGSFTEPHIVDQDHDGARFVGDEPLLLAAEAPVAVTANRAAGARLLIERLGCDFLIMDDGFQSAKIHFDYALIVVDSRFGLGNNHVIPAGPLRAPVADQLRFADALLALGKGDAADAVVRQAARAAKPVFVAETRPKNGLNLSGRRFLAFSGIGHPQKFFETVEQVGGLAVVRRAFPDHHFFAADELVDLAADARIEGLALITTSKDAARLKHEAPAAFMAQLEILDIEVVFDPPGTPERIIVETIEGFRRRRMSA